MSFQHILKKATVEAEIWGNGTFKFKDLVPSRLKHIHDRVDVYDQHNINSKCLHKNAFFTFDKGL